jgi:5-methylcytosine-specific restriction enzyme B
MSRYCGDKDAKPILIAAEHWRTHALQMDGSVLSDASLWSLDNLGAIEQYFVNALIDEEGTFLEKLQNQMAPAPPTAKQLLAEMLWFMLLCPSSISPQTKREHVQLVWSWSGQQLGTSQWLRDDTLSGVGSAGQGFNQNRWRELVFFVRFMIKFKHLDATQQTALLEDSWGFASWLAGVSEANARQLRHMILFLLYPDDFERIFGATDRREIVLRLTEKPKCEIDPMSPLELDRQLHAVRDAQEAKYATRELDFYIPPLLGLWKTGGFEHFTKDIQRDHVLKALQEIDRDGIPPDARSTTYDLIEGEHRYPPKLVLSIASKHATGEEFDRSLFSGGEASPAFALLRKLKFHIERKDFVESLLTKFLSQAAAADDLQTKSYPKSYRGLQIAVSFGQGNFSKIPWISFLGFEQKTSNGIYPVYLFYRELGVLILAYGISETNSPAHHWKLVNGAATVKGFLFSQFGATPDRYGDSFLFASYKVPDETQSERLSTDLDTLIAKYIQQFTGESIAPPEPVVTPPLVELEPFTIDQAIDGLFIDKARFKAILDLWDRKKNLILQGPPGVGKTFFCRRLAYALMHEQAADRVGAVQFHQTYSYEDFVQGYRPTTLGFERRNGLFYQFCERARDDENHDYVFVIDEINRGNLSKIFGELMMLIEADKRKKEFEIPLSYALSAEDRFFVPPNLYLLGLMNTADRSLAMVDYALRRRFAFVDLVPSFQSDKFSAFLSGIGVQNALSNKIIEIMTRLNAAIAKDTTNLGPGFCIGHSFFCQKPLSRPPDDEWYRSIIESEISPLLREYWFDQPSIADRWIKTLLAD